MDVLAVRTPDIEAWEADCLMFEGAYSSGGAAPPHDGRMQ